MVLLQNKPSVCLLLTLHSKLRMQSEVSHIYSQCVTEACKACKAGSASSLLAEETNRIIYRCKIFIWVVSVPPLLKYNKGESPFFAAVLKD